MADEDFSIPEAGMDDFAKATGGSPEPATPSEDQPRAPNGQWTSKEGSEPPATPAVTVETPPAATPPAADPATPAAPVAPEGHVPLAALQEERNKRQDLERQLAEARARPQTPQQPQQPTQPEAPVIWENPDGYIAHQLSPIQQELRNNREMMMEMSAGQRLGYDKLEAAKTAFEQKVAAEGGAFAGGEAGALAIRLFGVDENGSHTFKGNPFDALVEWHKRQSIFAEVGDDPRAWMEREMEKMLADPAKSAAIMEKIRAGAGQQPSPAVIPNGRSVPPSISAIPGGGGPSGAPTAATDMDAFRNATAGRSRR